MSDAAFDRTRMGLCNGVLQTLDSLFLHMHIHDKTVQDCSTSIDVHRLRLRNFFLLCLLDQLPPDNKLLEPCSRWILQERDSRGDHLGECEHGYRYCYCDTTNPAFMGTPYAYQKEDWYQFSVQPWSLVGLTLSSPFQSFY